MIGQPTVGGIAIEGIPVGHLVKASKVATAALAQRQSGITWEQIAAMMEPASVAIIEAVANVLFPGTGTIIDIAIQLHAREVPQSQDQTNAWMDKFGIGTG